MAFQGKCAVVVGGSGTIGPGIIWTLLKHGAAVMAPVRSAKGKASLEKDVAGVSTEKLQVLELDVATESGASQLADAISSDFGTVDYAVSAIGSWWQKGPLLEQPLSEVAEQIHALAVSHWLFAKAVVPKLKDSADSGHIIITGKAALIFILPRRVRLAMPDTGLVTVGAATLFGISTVLRAELSDKAFRLNEVRLSAFVARDSEANKAGGQPFSHRAFGEFIAHSLQDTSKKGEVIPVDAGDLEGLATD